MRGTMMNIIAALLLGLCLAFTANIGMSQEVTPVTKAEESKAVDRKNEIVKDNKQAKESDKKTADAKDAKQSGDKKAPIEEIVVTATRSKKTVKDAPAMVTALNIDEALNRKMSRTLPEAMSEIPSVMIQKTSTGQGSPYIRGFTGYQTLLLVDGIRLNNSVFRSGANQYWGTVDMTSVERLEVVRGTSSVLYGSDAVGGAVNAITLSRHNFGDGFLWDREVYYRFASANTSSTGRVGVSGSYDHDFAFTLGASLKDFNDLRAGSPTGEQKKTGYDDFDHDIKLEYFFNPETRLVLAHYQVDIDDAWRTHRTIYGVRWEGGTRGTDKELIYDQGRELTYLQFHAEELDSFIDALHASISYQTQEEDQYRVKSDSSSDRQGFDVDTTGIWIQLESPSPIGRWSYGVEYYQDDVDSYLSKYNANGTLKSREIQGPVADDSRYDLFGVYVQNDIELSRRWELILGTRWTYAEADAGKMKSPSTGKQTSYSEDWNSLVGSAKLVCHVDQEEHWNAFGGVSQGFRAPNLSDISRFDIARTKELEVPSTGLDPEHFTTYEVGIKTGGYARWNSEIAFYYTDIDGMIVRSPTGRVIDGNNEVIKKNAGDGFVQGVEWQHNIKFSKQWSTFGIFSWQEGRVDCYPTSAPEKKEEPMDRMMPTTITLGLRWDHPNRPMWSEMYGVWSADQDRLSTADKSDTQRIPPGGTPDWFTLNFRYGWEFKKNFHLTAALENIFDEDYRIHGSGVNEPGRNFVLSIDCKF